MSYTAFGQVTAPDPAALEAAAEARAKAAALSEWQSQGGDPRVFDALDRLVTGAAQGKNADSQLLQLASKAVNMYSPQQISDQSGVDAGIVAAAQRAVTQAIETGNVDMKGLGQGIGAAAGMGVCATVGFAAAAPVCGLLGAVAGGVIGGATQGAATAITHLFGGTTADEDARQRAEADAGRALNLLLTMANKVERRMEMGVAVGISNIYNRALSLGIPELPDPGIMVNSILNDPRYKGQPSVYYDLNGSAPEDAVFQRQSDYVGKVMTAVNGKYNNRWNKDRDESGYTVGVSPYIGKYDPNHSNAIEGFRLFPKSASNIGTFEQMWDASGKQMTQWPAGCSWYDVLPEFIGRNAPDSGMAACEGSFTQYHGSDTNVVWCGAPEALRAWRCHVPAHMQWLQGALQYYGSRWAEIATRSVSLVIYTQKQAAAKKAAADAIAKDAAAKKAAVLAAAAAKNKVQQAAASLKLSSGPSVLFMQATAQQSAKVKKAVAIGAVGVAAAVVLWVILD